jgi:hypothetical protein
VHGWGDVCQAKLNGSLRCNLEIRHFAGATCGNGLLHVLNRTRASRPTPTANTRRRISVHTKCCAVRHSQRRADCTRPLSAIFISRRAPISSRVFAPAGGSGGQARSKAAVSITPLSTGRSRSAQFGRQLFGLGIRRVAARKECKEGHLLTFIEPVRCADHQSWVS